MAFYEPLGDGRFRSTDNTVGPWTVTDQHAGPPSALLVRTLEQLVPAEGWFARIAIDLFGAVPVTELSVRSRVLRPGRSITLVEAELVAGTRAVARASGWWHRLGETADVASAPVAPPPIPDQDEPDERDAGWDGGYLRAMEWRWLRGHFTELGPAAVWTRMRMPLVEGEEPSPTQRVLATADSGNGVSAALQPGEWLFVNTDLSVHLHRPPAGEWICLDAVTTLGPTGGGLAVSRLSDVDGEVGRGAQALVVRKRG